MSGGMLDYSYEKVNEISDMIKEKSDKEIHRTFADHLDDVADALHDIEWVLSADYGEGDEVESILKVISKKDIGLSAIKNIKKTLFSIQEVIDYNTKE